MRVKHNQINQADYIIYSIIGLLLITTVISSIVLSSSRSSATDNVTGTASGTASTRASVTVSSSCSMYGTIAEGEEHNATIQNGRYQEDIGITTIKTFCNDPSGYAIYAVGYTNDEEGNNKLTSTSLPSSEYINSTATHLDGTASDWAMKLTPAGSRYVPSVISPFSNYTAIPTSYTKVVEYGSNTDARDNDNPDAIGSSFTTTYAASISPTQPAGTYTGQVKYVLMHPSNSDSPAVTTMQNVDYWGASLAVGEEVTATDNRDGNTYTVARLCTNWSGNNCTESQLWMTQNLDLAIGVTGTANLTSLNTDLNQISDNLGNNYDGYTYDTTINAIRWEPKGTVNNSMATISDFSYSGSATSVVSGWTNSQIYPYQADGKLNGNDVYIVTSGNGNRDTIYSSLAACKTDQTGTDAEKTAFCQHYKVGNYYNWTAAVAMNDTTAYTTQYDVMPNSICPKGWRLPQGLYGTTSNPANTADADAVNATQVSEFNKMLYANGVANGLGYNGGTTGGGQNVGFTGTGFNSIRSTSTYKNANLPLYFARSGDVNGTTLWGSSYYGDYWSSSVVSDSYAYSLYFDSGSLSPANRRNRNSGFSVRCVAR